MANDELSAKKSGEPSAAAAAVLAVAGAIIAAAEATWMEESVDAACIAAATAFARVSSEAASVVECEAAAWLASDRLCMLTVEHNRLARRSAFAANIAAEALA